VGIRASGRARQALVFRGTCGGLMPDEESIFGEALTKAEEQWGAYLDGACHGDAALRSGVEALLRAHREAGRFLETPPPGLAALAAEVGSCDRPDAGCGQPGTVVGVFKLLQRIGKGGVAVDYVAEH
jgi:hypothetical protein